MVVSNIFYALCEALVEKDEHIDDLCVCMMAWFAGATVGSTPEAFNHNLRTKWWRLMMQQFFRDAGIQVGRATLPPFSAVVYQFVGAASIPWPSHRIERIDLWIGERLRGAWGNGSVFKSLPLCGFTSGMDL